MEAKKGLKYRDTGDTINVQIVDADPDKIYVPGQAVLIADVANGKLVSVTAGSAATDDYCAVITDNQLKSEFKAGDVVEVALIGSHMVMEAGAAIAGGVKVEFVEAGAKVVGQSSGTVLGRTLIAAAADGDLTIVQLLN